METFFPPKQLKSPQAKVAPTLERVGLACLAYGFSGFLLFRGLGSQTPMQGTALLLGTVLLAWGIPAFYSTLIGSNDNDYSNNSALNLALGSFAHLLGVFALLLFDDPSFHLQYGIKSLGIALGTTFFLNIMWGLRRENNIAWPILSIKIFLGAILLCFKLTLSTAQLDKLLATIF